MLRKPASIILLSLLVISALALAYKVQPVKSDYVWTETIYIRADGSIDPPTAPISTLDNITYTLSASISDSIVIERDNAIMDGSGYALHGAAGRRGISFDGRSNIEITSVYIDGFDFGILFHNCSSITLSDNCIASNINDAIQCQRTTNSTFAGNEISDNQYGIGVYESSSVTLKQNRIVNNRWCGVFLGLSSCLVSNNLISSNNYVGIASSASSNGTFLNNTISNHEFGIRFGSSNYNRFYHNNFEGNNVNVIDTLSPPSIGNLWDDGYPSGGNYWSDYNGTDLYCGPDQNVTGSDGIGDTPYTIDANNQDNYPLMRPYVPFENQTIYIRADGSIDPSGAPVLRKGDLYTLTSNITSSADGIVIERDNIIVDGADHTIQGTASGNGIFLSGRSNVTIKNMKISGFDEGIGLSSSSDNNVSGNTITANNRYGVCLSSFSNNNGISGNNITANGWHGLWPNSGVSLDFSFNDSVSGNTITANNEYGVFLRYSGYNDIFGNNITANGYYGIMLYSSSNSSISGNNITANNGIGIMLSPSSNYNSISGNNITANNGEGMWLGSSSNSSIFGNNITNGYYGIYLDSSSNSSISNNNIANNYYGIVLYFSSNYNSISGNNITNNNGYGILLSYSSNNMVYHNNFINNVVQASIWGESANVWDDGYPSGGNYWNDYTSADFYSGPYQNQTGSDGIGDTSYVIDTSNQDNYPLMKPYGGSYDIGITNITTSKTVVGQGYSLNITIKILNYGINAQTFNVTVYANTTTIQTITSITLTSRNSTTLTFTWNTTGFAYGNYTLSAYAWPVPGETNVLDNNFTCGTVLVSVPGDVNADGKVDGKDLGWVAWCFGSYPGAPPPMTWDPNCDINNDGKIDGKDLGIVAEHFGEPHP